MFDYLLLSLHIVFQFITLWVFFSGNKEQFYLVFCENSLPGDLSPQLLRLRPNFLSLSNPQISEFGEKLPISNCPEVILVPKQSTLTLPKELHRDMIATITRYDFTWGSVMTAEIYYYYA